MAVNLEKVHQTSIQQPTTQSLSNANTESKAKQDHPDNQNRQDNIVDIKRKEETSNSQPAKKTVQIQLKSPIRFEIDGENQLSVHMETDRLTLSSATKADKEEYEWLICDRQVVNKYADWGTLTVGKLLEKSAVLHTMYTDRWNSKYPFSSFVVRFKELKNEFIGHIVLGNGSKPGSSEIAYLFHHTSKQGKGLWRQGLGTEAVGAVVQEYAPELSTKKYLVGSDPAQRQPLEKIVATSRLDNLGSEGILRNLKFSVLGQTEKFGAIRNEWEISVPTLVEERAKRQSNKT